MSKIAELRRSFDEAFAVRPPEAGGDLEDLLAIRIAGDLYAVRAREITGLATRARIVPVPGRVPELLGITAIRGALVPVYRLAALLGYADAGDSPLWLVLCGGREDLLALAFDQFEEYLQVPRTNLCAPDAALARQQVSEIVRVGTAVRSVINIPSVVEVIKARIGSAGPDKEQ